MPKAFKQLDLSKRILLGTLIAAGRSKAQIAQTLGITALLFIGNLKETTILATAIISSLLKIRPLNVKGVALSLLQMR